MTKKLERDTFDVALIDVDSQIYSVSWVHPNPRAAEKALIQKIEETIEEVGATEAYVFVKGDNNFRYQVDPEYKGNRLNKLEPEMIDRVDRLYAFAQDQFIRGDGGEADDYCAIYTYQMIEEGKVPIVCHIDKDLNMIPGWHWNYKKKNLYFCSPQDSFVAMCQQLLTGDPNDNIPGLYGVGPASANKELNNRFLHEMKDRILKRWEEHAYNNPRGFKDHWRDRFFKSANCLILRESLDELRPLTEEEILKKMTWTATNERFMDGITENIDMLENSEKPSPYSTKREARLNKTLCLNNEQDTGNGKDSSSTLVSTTDSSTTSTPSSRTNTTLGRKPSTATRKQSGLPKVTGGVTRQARKKLTS